MAYVMALQQGWPTDQLKFQGFGTILITSLYLFLTCIHTTKPFADAGEVRLVRRLQMLRVCLG